MATKRRRSATALPLGTRRVCRSGYIRIKVGADHHLAMIGNGWAYEHMVVMEKKLGRRLRLGELVHHRDDNKGNNSPRNLMLTSRPDHTRAHNPRAGTASLFCGRGHRKRVTASGKRVCRVCENRNERARYRRKRDGH